MFDGTDSSFRSGGGLQSRSSEAIAAWQAQQKLELDASMELLRRRQREERLEKLAARAFSYWPVVAGLLLAAVAPELRVLAASFAPWGMRLVFPFVVLAGRPELNTGTAFSRLLPSIMLYAQFPLEGLMARLFLRGRINVAGVALQVFFFHFLAAMELWIMSGSLHRYIVR